MEYIDLDSFILGSLNKTMFIVVIVISYIIFALLTSYPIEFWRKTPNLFAWILSIYLFQVTMLCPNTKNNYKSVLDPIENLITVGGNAYFVLTAIAFMAFNFVNYDTLNHLIIR